MTTTARDIADRIAERYDVDRGAALGAAELYLSQIEQADGRSIDHDAVSDEDSDFVVESYGRELDAQGLR